MKHKDRRNASDSNNDALEVDSLDFDEYFDLDDDLQKALNRDETQAR